MSTRNDPIAHGRASHTGGGPRPPLVLGIGNLLLGDDAVGLRMLEELQQEADDWAPGVEFVDGGTQGIALLGVMSDRPWMVLLDAVSHVGAPGTVYVMNGAEALTLHFLTAGTAHEGGAGSLLALATLTGDLSPNVVVVGVEPEIVRTGIGLSPAVQGALAEAIAAARREISRMTAGSPTPSAPEPAGVG